MPDSCGAAFAQQFYALLSDAAVPARSNPAVPEPEALDLTAIAREAAQLAAQYSAACEPVAEKLILLPGGG